MKTEQVTPEALLWNIEHQSFEKKLELIQEKYAIEGIKNIFKDLNYTLNRYITTEAINHIVKN